MYFMVGANNEYTNKATSLSSIKSHGFEVEPTRQAADYRMKKDGVVCGWLFSSRASQIAFLQSRGVL